MDLNKVGYVTVAEVMSRVKELDDSPPGPINHNSAVGELLTSSIKAGFALVEEGVSPDEAMYAMLCATMMHGYTLRVIEEERECGS